MQVDLYNGYTTMTVVVVAVAVLHIRPTFKAAGTHTHTHTHPFNGPMSGITWVSQYQKGKTNLDFTEARDSEWQWHPLGNMQDSTSLQSENHASTPALSFLQAGCPSCCPTNSVKALKARKQHSSIKSQTSFQYPKTTYLRNLLLQEKSRQPPFLQILPTAAFLFLLQD